MDHELSHMPSNTLAIRTLTLLKGGALYLMHFAIPKNSNLTMIEIPFYNFELGNSDANVHNDVEQPTYSNNDNYL